MKLGIASDHNGFNKKAIVIENLKSKYSIIDYGNLEYDKLDDYPNYAINLGEAVRDKEIDFGIVFCGTGIGVSIAANKVKHVRAAKVDNEHDAKMSRIDNNANIITLNHNKDIDEIINLIEIFINTSFSDAERHHRRVGIIMDYEDKND